MTASLLLAAGAGLAAVFVFAGLGRLALAGRVRIRGRLAALAYASPYERADTSSVIRNRRESSIPLLNALIRGRQSTDKTRIAIERAGLPLRVGEYFAIRLIAAMLGVLFGFIAGRAVGGGSTSVLLALGGLVIGGITPALFLRMKIRRRSAALEVQLAEFCDLMASMLESGFGYLQALTTTAQQVGEPLSGELGQMLDAMRLGGDIDEAFDKLNERMKSRDFDMVATAIAIQRRSGGNLAEILRGVAQTIRERQSFRREIRALTSSARFSATLLTAFPFVLAIALGMILPDTFARLITDTAGRIILGVAIGTDAVAYVVIKRVTKLEV